jgi:hypothetical protein
MPSRSRLIVVFIAGALAVALVTAPAEAVRAHPSMGKGVESEPEHVSDALAAIKKGKTRTARNALQQAIADRNEPKASRTDAADALSSLSAGHRKSARRHAEFGAGVEHFTYALRWLENGRVSTARGHLGEAVQIERFKKYAQLALNALNAGRRKAARQHIVDGLHNAKQG